MTTFFKDGEGRGTLAGVTIEHRIKTASQAIDIAILESLKGNAYNVNTLELAITADSAMAYLKNTGTKNIIITGFFYNQFQATAGKVTYSILRNPTAGTIVDDGTAIGANANLNFGSSKTLTADIYKGASGKTFSDGTVAVQSTVTGNSRVAVILGGVVIPQGKSVGIKVETSTASTISVAMACYEQNQEF